MEQLSKGNSQLQNVKPGAKSGGDPDKIQDLPHFDESACAACCRYPVVDYLSRAEISANYSVFPAKAEIHEVDEIGFFAGSSFPTKDQRG